MWKNESLINDIIMAKGSGEMFAKVYPREKYISKIRPFFDNDRSQKERAVSDEMALIKNVIHLYVYELILISTFRTVRPS